MRHLYASATFYIDFCCRKKKKKKLDKESIEAEFGAPTTDIDKKNSQATTSSKEIRPKTDAEKAFERVQRERVSFEFTSHP